MFIKVDFIKKLYFSVFFLTVFIFNGVYVNEEFYVAIGLFSFLLFLFFFFSKFIYTINFFSIKIIHLENEIFFIKYYNFLMSNFFFYKNEIYVWSFLNQLFLIYYNYKFKEVQKKFINFFLLKVFYKFYFNFLYNKFINSFLFSLLFHFLNFMNLYYYKLILNISNEKISDEFVLDLFIFSNLQLFNLLKTKTI